MAPRTRADVYDSGNAPMDEAQLNALIEAFTGRFKRINDMYIREMGRQLRTIGELPPSDVHRLEQIRRMNRSLQRIERQIAQAADMSAADVEKLLRKCAEKDARIATKILGVPDIGRVQDNPYLQRILEAQVRETGGIMRNLSNTTVDNRYYQDAVDEAVQAVQTGVEDYNTAIRRVVREAGEHGLRIRESKDGTKTRVVDYESGYSRRLDTAARMNVLDGIRHMNQNILNAVGDQFGADGVEIDAHMLCAEDHLPYQGRQYSDREFQEIQDSLERPFGEWNCKHFWHRIILGVSPRGYSDDELEKMSAFSRDKLTIDGRTKTRYEWSQEMRRMETAIRQQKDTAKLARQSGDKALQRRCQGTIFRLNDAYDRICAASGLKPEYARGHVPGFRDVKSTNLLTNTSNSGNISNRAEPAALRFVQHLDQFYRNASEIKPINGYEDIVVHGSKTGFEFRTEDGGTDLINVHQFALMLKESVEYHGGNIRLISCETGAEGSTTAQLLANDLNVTVLAPTDVVWINEEGEMTIGPIWGVNTGEWKLFTPKGE